MKKVRLTGVLLLISFGLQLTPIQPNLSAQSENELVAIDAGSTCLVAWSPDGSKLASVACRDTVRENVAERDDWLTRIWATSTWEQITTLGLVEAPLIAIDWHPDGEMIASFSENRWLRVWDVESGRSMQEINIERRWEPSESLFGDSLQTMSWHPNGRTLAMDHDYHLLIWDVEADLLTTAPIARTASGEALRVWGIQWSPDGDRLAVAYLEGYFSVLSEATLEPIFIAEPEFTAATFEYVQPLAWEPDGNRVAMVRNCGGLVCDIPTASHVQIFDASNGELLASLAGHEEPITAVTWSPDGHWLASSSGTTVNFETEDDSIRVWDMDTYTQAFVFRHDDAVTDIDWHPNENLVASASRDGTIRIWETPGDDG